LAGSLKANLNWMDPQGTKLLEESRELVFRKQAALRIIDCDCNLTATIRVTFGDAKDGAFGLRLAPVLQEESSAGHGSESKLPHTGRITNADGAEHEKAVWGKP
jgi:hypothetical protein